ncbi:MAG TPA: sulfotransferase [Rubrobacter sp.]|nr:sulfotransferase [Rubrobacter sp.]
MEDVKMASGRRSNGTMLESLRARARGLGRALRRAGKRNRTLIRIYGRLLGERERAYLELGRLRSRLAGESVRTGGVDPGRMVWIFGSGRSGSTWLRSMMGEIGGYRVWEEPMVGRLFGEFYARAPEENLRSADFVMGDPIRKGWIESVRNFVLDGARYSNPRLGAEEYLVIKEPNGSVGAPLLMEALPESRMILLVRDPRDVVASVLDAAREGGWLYESREGRTGTRRGKVDRRPNSFVRERANVYRRGVESARRAYDAHGGPKVLVRYEDLRSDTMNEMRRIYSTLGVPVDEDELRRAVEKHSWENVPEDEKGRGKFYRKGKPGSWREDLTPEQAKVIERVTASLLKELYPENV